MAEIPSNRKRSNVWLHYTPVNNDKAKCDICRMELSHKGGSTANLLRHLNNKHPTDDTGRGKQVPNRPNVTASGVQQTEGTTATVTVASTSAKSEETHAIGSAVETSAKSKTSGNTATSTQCPAREMSTRDRVQSRMNHFVTRPTTVSQQKALDEAIAYMICKDYQPFSIVEDEGFRYYSRLMNPSYSLPSRSTVTRTIMPHLYEKTLSSTKEQMLEASAVCLTTDGWTSSTNQSYIAYTAHFINDQYDLKSCLLECSPYTDRHTAENLRDELYRVTSEWNIKDKIVAVVSDNAADITAAIRLTGWTHLPCFAHTFNLVVQEGLKQIKHVQDKVKAVVEYFHRSTVASEKLKLIQRQMGVKELKLKQDVVTRWNSTFHMMARFIDQKEAIVSTLAIVNATVETPTAADGKLLLNLAPFSRLSTK